MVDSFKERRIFSGAEYENNVEECGSGFPAAISFTALKPDRGWPRQVGMQAKAAPTGKKNRFFLI